MSPVVLDLTKPAARARPAVGVSPHGFTALDVRSLIPWCVGLLRDRSVPFLYQPDTARHLRHESWRSMHTTTAGAPISWDDCEAEITRVIQRADLRTGAQYLMHRDGRGRRSFPYATRSFVWRVHLAYLRAKETSGIGDDHDLLHTTLASLVSQPLDTAPGAPHVVVINPDAWGIVGRSIAALIDVAEPSASR